MQVVGVGNSETDKGNREFKKMDFREETELGSLDLSGLKCTAFVPRRWGSHGGR